MMVRDGSGHSFFTRDGWMVVMFSYLFILCFSLPWHRRHGRHGRHGQLDVIVTDMQEVTHYIMPIRAGIMLDGQGL